jgi:predicted CXXCH cytochrome family protein
LGFWKLPDQVVRLAILFLIAGVVLVAVRHQFVPESFGVLGHYRADAVAAVAGAELHYAGRQACAECHDEEASFIHDSFHRTLSCEVCHGPAITHANDPDAQKPAVPRGRGQACLYCHEYLPSRPTGFPQIIEASHNAMEACIDCHNPHDPTPPETPGSCAGCHSQIARTKAVSHHRTLDCTVCHAATPEHFTSPRAHLPKKPVQRAFCAGCHDTSAQSAAHIPRIDASTHGGTYLCWQCHYPHHPEG